jgi:hypothetical protein
LEGAAAQAPPPCGEGLGRGFPPLRRHPRPFCRGSKTVNKINPLQMLGTGSSMTAAMALFGLSSTACRNTRNRSRGRETQKPEASVQQRCRTFNTLISLKRRREVAHPKRFELLTPRFVVWCSIQLSYGCLPIRRRVRRCAALLLRGFWDCKRLFQKNAIKAGRGLRSAVEKPALGRLKALCDAGFPPGTGIRKHFFPQARLFRHARWRYRGR